MRNTTPPKKSRVSFEKRIREINEMLSNCTIIDESTIDTKTVSVGCIVKLQDLEFGDKLEYKIVGVSEAKIEENLISNESPLGSALIGKKKRTGSRRYHPRRRSKIQKF
ncbi:MAG: GreA/GreB family elongation factor [Clostridiales bacterium]|nr:MAG: GreA/GreB family elongation factor [Clostridiales bacterium]